MRAYDLAESESGVRAKRIGARALFEDGKVDEAALAFEAARKARPGAWMAIDELTAYVLTKRGNTAGAALRALKPKSISTDDLKCLADAVESDAGSRAPWGPASVSSECLVLRQTYAPQPAPRSSGVPDAVAPTICAPRRNTETRGAFRPDYSSHPARYTIRPTELFGFASEADGRVPRAHWLLQIDDYEGALEVANRELRTYSRNPPLYSQAIRDEHDALLASAWNEDPGNLWTREDCSKEIRVRSHNAWRKIAWPMMPSATMPTE